jgi:hypothetical protein
MFHLHDTTRRRICLAGFLLLGVAPTLAVAGWCLSRRLPGYVQAEAQNLSRWLGLNVTLAGVNHVRPGVVLYEQLEAADPETGHVIFRCRLAELDSRIESDHASPRESDPLPLGEGQGVRAVGGCAGNPKPRLLVTLSQPEADAGALTRIWQCLQRALEGSCGPLDADVQFAATALTLRASRPHSNPLQDGEGHNILADHSQTLSDVLGVIKELPNGTCAQLQFGLAGVDSPKPTCIRVVRNRQASPPTSRFDLDTSGNELPCNVLAMALGELEPLGPRCRFRGAICATQTADGWQGEVAGQLIELDLGRLVNDYSLHKLSGTGEATIQSARFSRGRLEEGSAVIAVGPGTIDRSLMESTVDCLGLTPGPDPIPDGDVLRYEQLAFSATLDVQGLRLYGRCSTAGPGTILSSGRRCLLAESPQQQPAPVVSLVRALVPQSAIQVPATRQTDWLLRHLPVPEVRSPAGVEAAAPNGHVWRRY